jgi:hypothetical protein
MYATSSVPATPYAQPSNSGDSSAGSHASDRQFNESGPQVTSSNVPADFHAGTSATQAAALVGQGHFPNTDEPGVAYVNRPANTPPGAPEPTAVPRSGLHGDKDLLDYRVNSHRLNRLTPDRHGIYTEIDGSNYKTHFAKIHGNFYQVGGFDRATRTWRLLDPSSGREVFKLEKEGGQWTVKGLMPPRKTYPPGLRGRMFQALDGGIENVRQAKTQIFGNWSRGTSSSMQKLFGGGAFTPAGKARIRDGFDNTLRAMEQSKRSGGSNLSIGTNLSPYGPSAVAFDNGQIRFAPYALRTWSNANLNELMVHEHTHTGAGTHDHWYLNENLQRLPNWGGSLGRFTFNSALNNADTLARSTSVLANNQPT